MLSSNTIILILVIIILLYYIKESYNNQYESFTNHPSITEQIENSLNDLKRKKEDLKEHNNLYGKIYTKIGKGKYQEISKMNIDQNEYVNPYIHGLFDYTEKKYLDQVQKNKKLKNYYGNEYCKTLNDDRTDEQKLQDLQISQSELEKIEERLFNRNFQKLHHKYHHDNHMPHSHNNDKSNNQNKSTKDKESSGGDEYTSGDIKIDLSLLRKYNQLNKKTY